MLANFVCCLLKRTSEVMHRNRFILQPYSLYDLTPLICLKIRARKVKNYRVSILIEYCLLTKLDSVCPATLKTAKTVLNALWKLKHSYWSHLQLLVVQETTAFLWPPRWTLEKKSCSCRTSCLNGVSYKPEKTHFDNEKSILLMRGV